MVIIVRVHLTWHVDCTFFLDWRLIFTHVGSPIDGTISLSGLHDDHPSLHQGLQEDPVSKRTQSGKREEARESWATEHFDSISREAKRSRDAMQAWTRTRNSMIQEEQEGREGKDTAGRRRRVEEENNQEVTRTICRGLLLTMTGIEIDGGKTGGEIEIDPGAIEITCGLMTRKSLRSSLLMLAEQGLQFPSCRGSGLPICFRFSMSGHAKKGGQKKVSHHFWKKKCTCMAVYLKSY